MFYSQDNEMTLSWSITEIRAGCGVLKHLPSSHLWEHLEGVVTTVGGACRTLHHQQRFWVTQMESLSSTSLCCTYLIWSTTSDLSVQVHLCAATPAGRAHQQMHGVILLPQSNAPVLTTLSEIRISGCCWEAAEVPQALLLRSSPLDLQQLHLQRVIIRVFWAGVFFTPQDVVPCAGMDCMMHREMGVMQNTRARDDSPSLLISLYPKSV